MNAGRTVTGLTITGYHHTPVSCGLAILVARDYASSAKLPSEPDATVGGGLYVCQGTSAGASTWSVVCTFSARMPGVVREVRFQEYDPRA